MRIIMRLYWESPIVQSANTGNDFLKYVHELQLKTQNSLSNWHIQFPMEVRDLETPGVARLWAGFAEQLHCCIDVFQR